MSPAFEESVLQPYSNSKLKSEGDTNLRWSQWAESTWNTGAIELFIQSNPAHDYGLLAGGIVWLIASFVGMYIGRKNFEYVADVPYSVGEQVPQFIYGLYTVCVCNNHVQISSSRNRVQYVAELGRRSSTRLCANRVRIGRGSTLVQAADFEREFRRKVGIPLEDNDE